MSHQAKPRAHEAAEMQQASRHSGATGPLAGVRALDFAQAAAGPVSMMYLAMLGADVIKVESPRGDTVRLGLPPHHGMGSTFLGNNLGKRGVVLNMKEPEGLDQAKQLVKIADVALDNFRSPMVMERLGLGYPVMREINPRIIYVQSSAFGRSRGFEGMLSNEWVAQSISGFAGSTGVKNGQFEQSRGTAYLDWFTALVNLQAILIGLRHRERTGLGMMISTSQYAGALCAGFTRFVELLAGGQPLRPSGSERSNVVPDFVVATSDGELAISAPTTRSWNRLCGVVGLERWLSMPMAARVANRDELCTALQAIFRRRTTSEWRPLLLAARVPHHPVDRSRTISEIVRSHPDGPNLITQVPSARGDLQVSSPPWRFSRTPAGISRSSPELGEHQDEVFTELGIRVHPR
jgi:crotonobetainyl-CoA:carnitine CoA-transferase CaiB-like acyl-CoA transferase